MDHVHVGDLDIAFERRGEGPPILLLHGYVGDHRSWRPQLTSLADEFNVVAWDAPGFGESADPAGSFRLADYADCLAEFVFAVGLKRPHVVGLSWGGGLALELYRRHRALPRSLVLVSAYAGWAGSLPAAEVERRLQQALDFADLQKEQLIATLLPTMFTPSTPREVVQDFAATMSGTHPTGLRLTACAFAEADLTDVIPRVEIPVLLLSGDQDARCPAKVAEELHAKLPSSRLVVVPGTGHIVNLEAPDRVNAEIRTFVRSVEGGT